MIGRIIHLLHTHSEEGIKMNQIKGVWYLKFIPIIVRKFPASDSKGNSKNKQE